MKHPPLNQDRPFDRWPAIDPGRFIDFNPSHVRLDDGRCFAVIRRDRVPPVPGRGTVWAVEVDAAMRPVGAAQPLIADGEDPRAVLVNGRVLVFYVNFERDAQQRITGTSMMLSVFDPTDAEWRAITHLRLPKVPLGDKPPDSNPGWEKNWVPFRLSDHQVGLIYSHDPWQVLVMRVDPDHNDFRFENAYRADGLQWDCGGIRGGTPPVPHRPGELITFFHSSVVVGSRKSYLVGACILDDQPPFQPRAYTPEPLLISPYHGGMHLHGWPVAASVIFPLGCEVQPQGWRLLCGLDDGQIGSFPVTRQDLQDRWQALPRPAPPRLTTMDGEPHNAAGLLHLLPPGAGTPDWPLLRLLQFAAPRGRTLIDIGSDAGLYMAGLGPGYAQTHALSTTAEAAQWRRRNAALNDLRACTVHPPTDGILHDLDAAHFQGVDLVVAALAPVSPVLSGLRAMLARDQPTLLLTEATGADRESATQTLVALGYDVLPPFGRSPLALLAIHPSRRGQMAWFI